MGTAELAKLRLAGKLANSNVLPWSAVTVVFLGAVWFGIASCGGYAWHKTIFYCVASVGIAAALLLPSKILNSSIRKAVFVAILFCGYPLIEAAIAPFYPGPPGSIAEYLELFRISLVRGPCG